MLKYSTSSEEIDAPSKRCADQGLPEAVEDTSLHSSRKLSMAKRVEAARKLAADWPALVATRAANDGAQTFLKSRQQRGVCGMLGSEVKSRKSQESAMCDGLGGKRGAFRHGVSEGVKNVPDVRDATGDRCVAIA